MKFISMNKNVTFFEMFNGFPTFVGSEVMIKTRFANMPKSTDTKSLLQLFSTCEIDTQKKVCVSSNLSSLVGSKVQEYFLGEFKNV